MVDRADDLYGLAPGEFTAARDALAKELKAAGDKEAAAAVKALRRPTVVAWAINHAARKKPDELAELLAAGSGLRRAHDELMGGKGDRDALRAANEAERAAVGSFARIVRAEAADAGSPLAGSALDKVRDTLHAAALDEDVRAALEAGRLEREAEAVSDAGMLAAWAPATTAPKRSRKPAGGGGDQLQIDADAEPAAPSKGAGGGEVSGDPAQELAPKRTAADRRAAAAAHEAATKQLREADREAKRAEREADAARRKVDRAERAVEKARADLEDAEEDLAALQDQEREAQREVRDAKGALAAAQGALDAAAEQL